MEDVGGILAYIMKEARNRIDHASLIIKSGNRYSTT